MPDSDIEELLERPLADIGLSVRTVNTLESNGLLWVHELLACCGRSNKGCQGCPHFQDSRRTCVASMKLLDLPNFGTKTLAEVFDVLEEIGLKRNSKHPSLTKKRKRRKCYGGG